MKRIVFFNLALSLTSGWARGVTGVTVTAFRPIAHAAAAVTALLQPVRKCTSHRLADG